jgi:hypothetical protein
VEAGVRPTVADRGSRLSLIVAERNNARRQLMTIDQVVFLVGGTGSRLGTPASNTPKPILQVGGARRPLHRKAPGIDFQTFSLAIVLVKSLFAPQALPVADGCRPPS